MVVQRDINKEKLALKSYQSIYKKNPTTSEDWANLHRIAYPVTAGGLPDELKSTVDQSLYAGTGMASAAGASAPVPTGIDALKAGVDSARGVVENAPGKNEALRVLQEAVRAKSGIANQPIGESSLFKELGVTGYGALSASLKAQGDKLENDYAFLQNKMKEGTDAYISYNDKITNNYKMAFEEYKDAADRAERASAKAEEYKHDFDMMQRKAAIDKEFETWKMKNIDIDDAIKARDAGLMQDNSGNWINKSDTVITSPSGNSYDWSTYNAPGGLDYIKDVQSKINSIGKLNNYAELTSYINNNMTGSNIQPIDIINASEKTGVGWEELLAILQKESIGGTSNVAKKNNNFGGITWSSSYQESHPNATKGTPRPANEGGNYVKFKTVEDGLMAQAEQFTRRKIAKSANVGNDRSSEILNDIDVVTSNMSVATKNSATKAVNKLLQNGETEKAQALVNQYAVASMKGTIRNDFNSFNLINSNLSNVLSDWDKLATDSGPYKQWEESGKPFLGVVKDQKWIKFVQEIEQNQAKYRNAIYGASLTENEKESSNRFMVDPSRDDIKTIRTKIEGMKQYAESALKAFVDVSIGKPSPAVDTSKLMSNYSIVAPDGNTYSFSSQEDLDKFKKDAGIK